MPILRNIDKNFFKTWTKEMAYTLGFIFADGSVVQTKRGTWFWSIQITDRSVLNQIKIWLDSTHKLSVRKTSNSKHKKLFRLQIGSKSMCEDLIKLGVICSKSNTMDFPVVPDSFVGDFVKGYFDGDGNVWIGHVHKERKRPTLVISAGFTSGSEKFLLAQKDRLELHGLRGGSIVKKDRGYALKYSTSDSLKLYNIMYNSTVVSFGLLRKQKRFEKYIDLQR